MESLELLGREILPEFQDRERHHAREKATRLAPVLDAVRASKPATDHPPLPSADYETPAIPPVTADRAGPGKFHRHLDDLAEKMASGEDVRRRLG